MLDKRKMPRYCHVVGFEDLGLQKEKSIHTLDGEIGYVKDYKYSQKWAKLDDLGKKLFKWKT